MTKHVRIENADTSDFKVIVETWDKGKNGEPDTLAQTERCDYPTAMAETWISSTRYIVVREAAADEG